MSRLVRTLLLTDWTSRQRLGIVIAHMKSQEQICSNKRGRYAEVAVLLGCLAIGVSLVLAVPGLSVLESAERSLQWMRFRFTDCGQAHGCTAIPEAYAETPRSPRSDRGQKVADALLLAMIAQFAYVLLRKAPLARS